jgi:hypothetical protein
MDEMTNKFLDQLLAAPDSQLDKSIVDRLKEARTKSLEEFKTELRHCIDDCVYGSLASGFALQTLHIVYEAFLGGKLEDFNNEDLCPWRKER